MAGAPEDQRKGMAFLVANMPDRDLKSLRADFLLENTALAYKARAEAAWGRQIPDELFLNNVLAYANLDEARDAWRKELYELCMPLVKDCKTPGEAAQKLNAAVFTKLNVRYSTQRKQACQSPRESIDQGMASCTGLSILLSDACRSVAIPHESPAPPYGRTTQAITPGWKSGTEAGTSPAHVSRTRKVWTAAGLCRTHRKQRRIRRNTRSTPRVFARRISVFPVGLGPGSQGRIRRKRHGAVRESQRSPKTI